MVKIVTFLRNYIGGVKEEDKEQIHNTLEEGAEPDVDYFMMVALSCVMVTLGLILNNVAVVIGAMLIAPLMTSIITMALGIVRGDFKLFFRAAEAEAKGALLTVVVAVFITLFSPFTDITPEILSRTSPDLFYLIIALAAGAAGAYAISRPKLSTMLPGVAIATAILPPLATVGIGLGLKRFDIAFGALLLFLTNLIAINLASTVVFWILGVGPRRAGAKTDILKGALKKTVILLAIVAIPLTWIMLTTLDEINTTKTIQGTIDAKLLGMYQTELVQFQYQKINGALEIVATIRTAAEIDEDNVVVMKSALEEKLGKDVSLTVEIVQLNVYEAN